MDTNARGWEPERRWHSYLSLYLVFEPVDPLRVGDRDGL